MEYKQNQEAFNVMVKHLRAQGEKSLAADSGFCRYRGVGGLKCAIGCLVEDEHFDSSMEGSFQATNFQEAMTKSGWTEVSNSLLLSMQGVHDAYLPKEWEEKFINVAKTYDLTIPEKE